MRLRWTGFWAVAAGAALVGAATVGGSGAASASTGTAWASTGTASASTAGKSTLTARPSAPFVESVAGTGLGLLADWAPASAGAHLTAYSVTAKPASGSPRTCRAKSVTARASNTQSLVGGLCAGVVYTVTVRSKNAAGYSPASNVSSPVVPLAAQRPGSPLITSVTPRNQALALWWAAPADNGGRPITRYTLAASANGEKTVTVQAAASATSGALSGLVNGATYKVSLTASSASGTSPAATGSGMPAAVHAPSSPPGLTVVPNGKGRLVASWAAPADNGGSAVTGYAVSYRRATFNASTGQWAAVSGAKVSVIKAGATTTSVTASSFPVSRAFYLFSVTASNKAGTSAADTQQAAVTPVVTEAAKVTVLSAATVSRLSAVSGSALAWPTPAPAQAAKLAVGQTVVAGPGGHLPDGTLRQVTSVSDKNGTLTVATQPGDLGKAFSALGVAATVNPVTGAAAAALGRQAARSHPIFRPSMPGVRVMSRDAGVGFGAGVVLSIDASVGHVQISAEASLTTSINVSLGVHTGFLGVPDGVSVSSTAKVTAALDGDVKVQGNWSTKIGEIDGAPVDIQVGPVPVVIVPKVPVFLTASGSAGLGLEVSGTVGGAVSWSSADPTHLVTQNLSSGPTVDGRVVPGVTVTGEVKVGLQVQPQAGIYDAAGPNIEADLDDDARIDFNPAPGDPFLTIAKEIDLKAGVDLDLLGQHVSLDATIGAFQFGSFTIEDPPTASYTITPSGGTVSTGGTLALKATRSDGATKSLTWRLVGGTRSDSISGSGVLHASAPAGRTLTVTVSDVSGAAGETTVTVGLPFDAPSSVTATQNASGTGASVIWKPPARSGGSALAGYRIMTQPSTGLRSTSATARSVTLPSLAVGTYVVSVYAVNKAGRVSAPGTAEFSVGKGGSAGSLSWQPPVVIDQAQDSGPLACATMSFCVDVGASSGSATIFNGTKWTDAGPVVNNGWLLAASCPTTTFCAAVGNRPSPANASVPAGDAVLYNGTSWSKPTDLTGAAELNTVSCASATWCVAAGNDATGNVSVFTFNGKQWSEVPDPVDYIVSVSCVSATFCAAAEVNGDLQYFNGTTWSTPYTGAGADADTLSVSCSSDTYCLAVALWEQTAWVGDGSTWQAVSSTSAPTGGFNGVSCAGGACDATANTDGNNGVYSYQGSGNWSPVQAVGSYGGGSISCPAAGQCMVMGQVPSSATPYALYGSAFTLSGKTWLNAAPDRGTISALSCPTAQFCAAADKGYTYKPLNFGGPWGGNAMTYNGSAWSTPEFMDYDQIPGEGFTWSNGVTGLSCATSTLCAAVDSYGYAFIYSGSSWGYGRSLTQNTVVPLTAVSCGSPTLCAAVAEDGTAYVYNGSSWSSAVSVDPYSDQAGGSKHINGNTFGAVSCGSSASCEAVDSFGYTFTYSNGTWSAGPQLPGSAWASISCGSATSCVAVGADSYAALTGTSWSAPKNIDSAAINAVSCTSPTFCEAVDANGDAMTFNGSSWTAPSPALSGIPLTTVSCAGSGVCTAVGVDPATMESEAISSKAG